MIPEFKGVRIPPAAIKGVAALVLTAVGDRLRQFSGTKDGKVIELNIEEDKENVIVTPAIVEAAESIQDDLEIPEEGRVGNIPDFFGKPVSLSVLIENDRKAVE